MRGCMRLRRWSKRRGRTCSPGSRERPACRSRISIMRRRLRSRRCGSAAISARHSCAAFRSHPRRASPRSWPRRSRRRRAMAAGLAIAPTSSCAPTAPSRSLGDTFGGRIGWTVQHSQSGYNAVRYHLLGRQGAYTAQWIGPLITPRRVIEAVLRREIDVGPLDSYVHDLLRRHEPETAAKLRVVDSTAMTPIPASGRVARHRERCARAAAACLAVLPLRAWADRDARDAAGLALR